MKRTLALEDGQLYSKNTVDVGTAGDPVEHVDCVPTGTNISDTSTDFDVITIQRSGKVTNFSKDLKTTHWTADIASIVPSPSGLDSLTARLRFATVEQASTLVAGPLRNHPEILLQLQPAVSDRKILKFTHVLCTILEEPQSDGKPPLLHFRLHMIQQPSSVASMSSHLRRLVEWQLPPDEKFDLCNYNLDIRTGLIQRTTSNAVSLIDLASTFPMKSQLLSVGNSEITGCAHIRGPLVIVSSKESCTIHNLRYQTVLDRRHTSLTSLGDHQRKRKRPAADSVQGPIRIVQFFPKSGRVVGLSKTHIVALNINPIVKTEKHKRRRIGLLAHSLGQRASHLAQGETNAGYASQAKDDTEARDWITYKSSIDKASATARAPGLDAEFCRLVVENGTLSAEAVRKRALYVLSKIFGWHKTKRHSKEPATHSLHILCIPSATSTWLMSRGYFTASNIQKSLRSTAKSTCPIPVISIGDLVESMAHHDHSLTCLCEWIELQPQTDPQGLVHALRILLESFEASDNLFEDQMLTNDVEQGEQEMKDVLSEEETAAQHDLQVATTFLEDGLQVRARAIRLCLNTLAACFQPSVITTSLTRGLERRHILLLIDLLRFDLVESGWGSNILDFSATAESGEGRNKTISPLCTLLNCAVDALGGAGWLSGSYGLGVDQNLAEGFVSTLRMDTSAVLAGIQESTFFTGFLKDFLRFEETLAHSSRSSRSAAYHARNEEIKPDDLRSVNARLPLGLSSVQIISQTRIADGGEIYKRTGRDMREEVNRRQGVYSFGRINI